MKKIKYLIALLILLASLTPVFNAQIIAADEDDEDKTGIGQLKGNLGTFGDETGLGDADTDTNLRGKIANIINIVLSFLGVIAVIMIITAGYQWMMAGGNEEKVKEAKTRLKNAIIGLALVLLAFIIINYAVGALSSAIQNESGGGGGSGTNP